MKNLTLIIHADSKLLLTDILRGVVYITGFTFTSVEGHGSRGEYNTTLAARDRVVGYIPHVRVDIVLQDKNITDLLEVLRQPQHGFAGRGIFWVTPVSDYGQL